MNSPNAGKKPNPSDLIDVDALIRAYHTEKPDPEMGSEEVVFGTSGHRGTSLERSFNEDHILAMTQAICDHRKRFSITGPLMIAIDTHALSFPAYCSALEVLTANDVTVLISTEGEYTPTPVISHAIVSYNKNRRTGLADGIVITPSHNPPGDGGFKYNPPHGGPAEKEVTDAIQIEANEYLRNKLKGVKKLILTRALKSPHLHSHDFITPYVQDLENVIDFNVIRNAGIRLAIDPMGGSGVHYWQAIADYYMIDLEVLNTRTDPTFSFMTLDWDGEIRMDPSSPFVMQSLIEKAKGFDLAFGCDTDHDRHGIVTPDHGLMPSNEYLTTAIYYLFTNRPQWSAELQIGKTMVSSQMIDRVALSLGRHLYEVPVGFKWFVDGLAKAELGFVGEESAGATFLRRNGETWTTDKDGFIPCLLAAEMTAKLGKNPAKIYQELTQKLGTPSYRRVEAKADAVKRNLLKNISEKSVHVQMLAGERIESVTTHAPANNASFGGIKVETQDAWFATRPSGTEDIYKIYGESFLGEPHLNQVLEDAQKIVDEIIGK